jgi:hypothetical protein
VFLVGGIGGWVSALGGAWKDAPIEGFHWLKFWRSPLLAGSWALVVSQFTSDIVVIAIAALGFTVATTETYKTFFFPSRPRGKFQGKPVLYPDLLRFRRRFVPLYAFLWLLIVLALLAALDVAPAWAEGPPQHENGDELAVDMAAGWLRRDWRGCSDPTSITFANGTIAFDSRSSAAMVWQVPTVAGPLVVDPAVDWVRACDRAPQSFFRRLAAERGTDGLVDLSELPYLHWHWRVDGGVEDSWLAHRDGRIREGHDDFAAKLGVLVQASDGGDVHEIAYVWARSKRVGTVLRQETTVLPLLRKVRAHRIVVEVGRGWGRWVEELHDLRADFARLLPGRQAGRVLRIYLMTDSDDTRGSVGAAYADIRFLRSRRPSPWRADHRDASAPAGMPRVR